MDVIVMGLVASAGAAGTLSAVIVRRVTTGQAVGVALSIARYGAWLALGGFIAAALLPYLR